MQTVDILRLGKLVSNSVEKVRDGMYQADLKGWLFDGKVYFEPETLEIYYGNFEQFYAGYHQAEQAQIDGEIRKFFQKRLR